mmetsp:Transcript_20102/g.33627  ORF Transcript_20102/g.33627 Transcript_20102/m.33627 type:complete len:97 (+) Transcript_20102:32-322(+)
MALGSACFPIILAVPMWDLFLDIDADVLVVLTVTYVVCTMAIMIITSNGASVEQAARFGKFQSLLDPSTCLILPEYYPPDAEMQLEDHRAMYRYAE